jgi:hypothetical protein
MTEKIDHDRLFKELIQTYFEEFILLFYPEIFEWIDFTHLKFLDKELNSGPRNRKKRRVDLIVETKLLNQESLIIVHIESQASYQIHFNQRMFVYFSRLFEKYHKPILPIAIFSYDEPHDEPSTFKINFPFLRVLHFQYFIIELKKKNWRDFVKQDNPVAGALLSKMGYNNLEKVEVKKAFLRMMVRLQLDPARTEMLTGFF